MVCWRVGQGGMVKDFCLFCLRTACYFAGFFLGVVDSFLGIVMFNCGLIATVSRSDQLRLEYHSYSSSTSCFRVYPG